MDTTPAPWPSPPSEIGAPPYRSGPAPLPFVRPPVLTPFRPKELAAALAIVVTIDACLWSADELSTGGLGLATLFAAVPLIALAALGRWRRSPRLVAIAALLAIAIARTAIHPTVLTTISGLALIGTLVVALRARRTFVPQALASLGATLAMLPQRTLAATAGVRELASRTRLGRIDVLPIVVPLALCAMFVGVFALANPLIADWLALAWDALLGLALPPIGRVIGAAIAALAALALLRPARRLARGDEAAKTDDTAADRSLALARNVLVGVNLVFVAYHLLDAAYLWSGRPPEGMTTQRYAHAGAFWLTVALALLTAVVGVLFRGALAHDARARGVRVLAYAWLAQGLVLALGTYRRIAIHVAHTGLSNLRIVGVLGTTLVVVGVILVGVKLRRTRSFTWMLRRQLDALAITTVLFAAAPTHWLSAEVDVARIGAGEEGPLLHLAPLAQKDESAPALVPLLDHPDPRVREGVAALLEQARARIASEVVSADTWREHDLWTARALARLDAAAPRIAEVLGDVDRGSAIASLTELASAAAYDRPSWERAAIPDARSRARTYGDGSSW